MTIHLMMVMMMVVSVNGLHIVIFNHVYGYVVLMIMVIAVINMMMIT